MKIFAICATPYQIMVCDRIIEEYYRDSEITIVLTDDIADCQLLFDKMKTEDRYSNVYLWKTKSRYVYGKWKRNLITVMGWPAAVRFYMEHLELEGTYDVFLYANFSFPVFYAGIWLRHRNRKLKIFLFEDGFSTYSDFYGNFYNNRCPIARITKRFFYSTNAVYVFNPRILSWKPQFEVIKITPDFSGKALQRLNRVFDYESLKEDYHKKVIFFEESYFADGRQVDDVELVDDIAKLIGKENIIIKIHPRNPYNRFLERGFCTSKNTSIPWEMILLNERFEHSIFVTIASNAAMNPFFLFGMHTRVILLFKCTRTPEALREKIIRYDEEICSRHPNVFSIPSDYNELDKKIKMLVNN